MGFTSIPAVRPGHKVTAWAAFGSWTSMLPDSKPIHLIPGCARGGNSYSRAVLDVSMGEGGNLGGGAGMGF